MSGSARPPGGRARVLEDTAATTAPPAPHCRRTADVVSVRTLHVLLDFFVFTANIHTTSPYFDPTHTRTGWIGQPPILNRHEVVTIGGDVDTLGQATP